MPAALYWYMQQISGERLQDHWSSGVLFVSVPTSHFYAPNFEKVGRAYCFRLVCVCVGGCVC